METLRITEIFYSLQGESLLSGLPTVFIRLTGCPLRCNYCDTEYAFSGGERMTLEEICTQVASYECRQICVTGGEPLAQKQCLDLMNRLCDMGYSVSIETSGALAIEDIDSRVVIVMDLKTPNSGEMLKNRMQNIAHLTEKDQVKFVICNERDYQRSKMQVAEHQLNRRCTVLFSPSHEELDGAELAAWILADRLEVRMQVQLHKILWGDKQGV
ncbi:MAG: 7-carboxy-7-deazaguanine synthase QueE [Gammaproteobacteria bacterium]|nr:MAG: 7-carboxy-7-deazaguanine synthase QueE [Gammaproteobacteria bacterium]